MPVSKAARAHESTAAPLCIGHSHVTCVKEAATRDGTHVVALNFWDLGNPLSRDENGIRLGPELARRIREHAGPVFSMMGGSAHTTMGLLVHPQPFDFVLPTHPELPLLPDAKRLPAGTVRMALAHHAADYIQLTRVVADLAQHPIAHLQAPPPHADSNRISRDVIWALYPGMSQQVAPASFRYKLWLLHSQVIEQACRDADIAFIRRPDRAVDAHGFLHADFYRDGVHASADYGALLLEQMRSFS